MKSLADGQRTRTINYRNGLIRVKHINSSTLRNTYATEMFFYLFIYLLITNTITNYILIIYELNNFDHVLAIVSQTRVSGGNRTNNFLLNPFVHKKVEFFPIK